MDKRINTFRFYWERLIIFLNNKFSRKTLFQVSIANTGTNISRHPLIKDADIIHLHWINQGFLSLKDIRELTESGKPVIWTMHDMWPCTGICHHSYGCKNYEYTCGNCPFLRSDNEHDLSNKVFLSKKDLFKSEIQVTAVSTWLKKMAQASSLFHHREIYAIPNLLDTSVFRPGDKMKCREELGLPAGKKIIVTGAAILNETVKGFGYINQALQQLSSEKDLFLVLFGRIKNDKEFLDRIKIPYKYLGQIDDTQSIAKLYAAADVTLAPSLYETFGQTIAESMACGCPAVSFDNSGQTDIIDHKINGYLAKYKNPEDFATGILWILNHPDSGDLQKECIKKVQSQFSEQIVSRKYISLYEKLLNE